jgi:hypothetical protein
MRHYSELRRRTMRKLLGGIIAVPYGPSTLHLEIEFREHGGGGS